MPTREMVPSGPCTSSIASSLPRLELAPCACGVWPVSRSARSSSALAVPSSSLPGLRGVVAGVSTPTVAVSSLSLSMSAALGLAALSWSCCLACCEKARARSAAATATDVSSELVPAVVYDSEPHSNSKSSPRSMASWKSSSSAPGEGESAGGERPAPTPASAFDERMPPPALVVGRESPPDADGLERSSMMTSGGEGALAKWCEKMLGAETERSGAEARPRWWWWMKGNDVPLLASESESGETASTGASDRAEGGSAPDVDAARSDWARSADAEMDENAVDLDDEPPPRKSSSSVVTTLDSTLPARLTPSLPARRTFFFDLRRCSAASPVWPSESTPSPSSSAVRRSLRRGIELLLGADDEPDMDCVRRWCPAAPAGVGVEAAAVAAATAGARMGRADAGAIGANDVTAVAAAGGRGAGMASGVVVPEPSGDGAAGELLPPMAAIMALDARRFLLPRPMPASSVPPSPSSARTLLNRVELSPSAGGIGGAACCSGASPRT